jgi:hypothetical protein
MKMSTKKSSMFGLALAMSGLMGLASSAVPTQGHAADVAATAKFKWTGNCVIQCSNGRCEPICLTDTVIAIDAFDAKLKAEAALRAKASTQGTIIEGTVQLTVVLNLFEFDKQSNVMGHVAIGREITLAAAEALVVDPESEVGAISRAPIGARIGVNVPLTGEHYYYIRNTTNHTISVTVTATLWDSEGGRTVASEPVVVGAGLESRGRLRTVYARAFGRPGGVLLFGKTELSGDASATYTGQSSFYVAP